MITKVYFPVSVLPFSSVLSGLVDFAIGFVVLIGVTLFYGMKPVAPAALLPLFLLSPFSALRASASGSPRSNALYRDVNTSSRFLLQFWDVPSPCRLSHSLVPQRWRWLYGLNPMAGSLTAFAASPAMATHPRRVSHLFTAVLVHPFSGGLVFFQRMEGTVADRV